MPDNFDRTRMPGEKLVKNENSGLFATQVSLL
jgi:hypothetical protein